MHHSYVYSTSSPFLCVYLSEWSKESHSSCDVFVLVGSNPTVDIFAPFANPGPYTSGDGSHLAPASIFRSNDTFRVVNEVFP